MDKQNVDELREIEKLKGQSVDMSLCIVQWLSENNVKNLFN